MPSRCLSADSFKHISEYADVYGKTDAQVIEEAVALWWEHVGEYSVVRARELGVAKKTRKRRKAIQMPCLELSSTKKAVNE